MHFKEFQDSNAGKLKKEKMELSSKRQQLDRVLGHLKLDLEHLVKGETELDEEIGFRTREFRDKKEELLQAKTGVQVSRFIFLPSVRSLHRASLIYPFFCLAAI